MNNKIDAAAIPALTGANTAPTSRTTRSQSLAARTPLYVSIGLQLLSLFVAVRFVRTGAWDDGAITLAFSKTFAQTGRIALTPLSEQVEGFSSLTWFLINSAVAAFNPSFEQAIALSQMLASGFLIVSLCYLFRMCGALSLSRSATYLVLIVLAVSGPSFAEISNGMEMTLLGASGLATIYYLYFSPAPKLAMIAIVLFVATRFESCFYYPFLIAPMLLQRRGKAAIGWLCAGAVVFLVCAVWRYHEFADFLPNTIYAKLNPPYRLSGLHALRFRVLAPFEIMEVLAPLVAVVAGLYFLRSRERVPGRMTWAWRTPALDALLMAVVAAELFAFVTGKNWGYDGRMTFFALPCALLLLALAYDRMSALLNAPARTASLLVAFLTVPLSWETSAGQQVAAIRHSLYPTRYGTPSLSPEFFRDTALAVERLRGLLHMQSITYMTADIGGVGLCCSEIRLVDIGLLTSRTLARGGYGKLGMVLAAERPDVIETRWEFAALPGIYRMDQFKREYTPVLINRTRFFLRKDHAEALLLGGFGSTCPLVETRCSRNIEVHHRYHATLATNSVDDAQYFQYGSYIEVP